MRPSAWAALKVLSIAIGVCPAECPWSGSSLANALAKGKAGAGIYCAVASCCPKVGNRNKESAMQAVQAMDMDEAGQGHVVEPGSGAPEAGVLRWTRVDLSQADGLEWLSQ